MLIQSTPELIKFLRELGTPPYVALDTEFISEKTYYPQLCLMQIAYGAHAAMIDTLSGLDLDPLIGYLKNPEIVKVFHAADQDLAIFQNEFKLSLSPIFDTQIAAMVCGFGDQVSFGQLVKTFTNTRLDKSAQIVDWSKRPLLERHASYALGDVTNLIPVYEALLKDIEKRGRASWVKEEMRELSDPNRYDFDLKGQLKKLNIRGLNRRRLIILSELVLWREAKAKSKNIPRGWVIKDLTLRDIVSHPPQNLKDLGRVRSIGGNAQGQLGQEILSCIRRAEGLPLEDCPDLKDDGSDEQASENVVVLLRALLKHVCRQNKVAPKLVATKPDLEQFALGGKTRFMGGWRQEVFGALAGKLLSGKIALALAGDKIKIVKRD